MAKSKVSLFTSVKKVLGILWILAVVVCIILYIIFGEYLTPTVITQWIRDNTQSLLLVYCLVCIARGLTLMPSTPFILVGILLFPGSPELLLAISLICILLSSLIIYYASGYLGFADYFDKSHAEKIAKIRAKLEGPSGFYFIGAWCLLPFTPTDLIVYVAGSIKLPFRKIVVPLMLGEAAICAIYIFNGVKLLDYFY